MTGIYDSPVPRLPLFLNTPTRPATIQFGITLSLLIETLTGTHVGTKKLSTEDFILITSTGRRELKFLKRGCPQSKNATTGEWFNSGLLR